jgi:hypothetical protein
LIEPTATAAAIGLALGWFFAARPVQRGLLLVLFAAAFAALSLLAALNFSALYNPLIAILALLLACEAAAAVHRLHRVRAAG